MFAMIKTIFRDRNTIYLCKSLCKTAALKKTENLFSRQIIAYCRSKVLQNAEKGAFCNTFNLH